MTQNNKSFFLSKNARKTFALLAACVLALCACNPAPKYARPPAPMPTAYKEAPTQFKEGAGWKLAQPGDDKIRAKWWEVYNDPQLNALEEQVAISNQTLKAAEANFRAARALVVQARSALFPTIGASPGYSNSRQSATTRAVNVPNANLSAVTNGFTLPFDISYEPDFWHRIRNTIAVQAFDAQAAAADVATALLSTQTELATDYFELRASDMQRKILDDTMNNYRQNVDLTTTLYKTGINSEQDLTQAQNQLDTATAQATDLGVARAQYEHAIAALIGKPPSEVTIAVGTFNADPPQIPVAVPSSLLERRPDIASLERKVAAANSQIGVNRAAYFPTLTLSASGGFETSQFTQWFNWPSRFWSLGPTLSQTLFDGGLRRGLNEQSQALYDAAVANYRQGVITSFQAVEDQLAALRILSQEITEQQTAINSSQHYLDLANIRFKTGVDSYLNVITAENSLLSNREAQVSSELRRMSASVSLVMALGGGWDPASLPQMNDLISKSATAGTPVSTPTH
jgi:NodT family efflux transporter outer membrane factor (OMF) lipoprotein